MKHLISGAIMFAVFILQNTLTSHIEILGIAPSFMLVLIVAYALWCKSPWECVIYSGAGGALLDLMWGRVFGFGFILTIYVGIMVYYAGEYFYRHTVTKSAFMMFVATILWESVFYLANFTLFGDTRFLYAFFRIIVPAGAYNAMILVLVYGIMGAVNQKKKESEDA